MSNDLKDNLNPEPTDVQLACFRRHKVAGTSPGNPKWYRPLVVKPFVFKAELPPNYPRLPTGQQFRLAHDPCCIGEPGTVYPGLADTENPAEYIKAFEYLNHLKPLV
jgi:hypothetical protein